MIKTNLILFILLLFSIKDYAQADSSKDVIIDPIVASPYLVDYESIIVLPDSLGGSTCKGLAAIEGKINDSLKIGELKIIRLQLHSKERAIDINYYYGQDSLSIRGIYPFQVYPYLYFFEKLSGTAIVKKQKEMLNPNMNRVTLIFRFK